MTALIGGAEFDTAFVAGLATGGSVVAVLAAGTVAWRALHDQPPTSADWNCWRLVASDWPRHVRVIHDTPETTT